MPGKIYQWDNWLSRPETILWYGIDYESSQASMSNQIRNAASKRGLSVNIKDRGASLVITISQRTEQTCR